MRAKLWAESELLYWSWWVWSRSQLPWLSAASPDPKVLDRPKLQTESHLEAHADELKVPPEAATGAVCARKDRAN